MKTLCALMLLSVAMSIALDSGAGNDRDAQSGFPPTRETQDVAYDQGKCIESCDMQYSTCTSKAPPNDADHIKYCSNQHDSCRRACLEHG